MSEDGKFSEKFNKLTRKLNIVLSHYLSIQFNRTKTSLDLKTFQRIKKNRRNKGQPLRNTKTRLLSFIPDINPGKRFSTYTIYQPSLMKRDQPSF